MSDLEKKTRIELDPRNTIVSRLRSFKSSRFKIVIGELDFVNYGGELVFIQLGIEESCELQSER